MTSDPTGPLEEGALDLQAANSAEDKFAESWAAAKSSHRQRVAFFDLDRTLIDVNSANLWLAHEIKQGTVTLRDAARGAYWLIKYRLGHSGAERAYAEGVRRLEGQPEDDLAERARDWVLNVVVPRIRPGAQKAIDAHRRNGDRLVLATSSTVYAAWAAVDAFKFDDAICTEFEVVDGVFTGRISNFAFGDAKALRVQNWCNDRGIALEDCTFYTDSVTDLELLDMVGEPVAVNPDRPLLRIARRRGWRIEYWGQSNPSTRTAMRQRVTSSTN